MVLAAFILSVLLGSLLFYTAQDAREYGAFKNATETSARQHYYRKWLAQSLALFGVGSLISLALTGQWALLTRPLPALSSAVDRWLPKTAPYELGGFFFGMLASALVSGLLVGVILKRRSKVQRTIVVGDVGALLPRNRAERGWAVALALNAGLSEELFFRLLLPVLLYSVFGHALFALAAAVLIFGLVHIYQGWAGVLATTLMGTVLMSFYLATGSLGLVILIHALVDLNGLIVQPFLRTRRSRTQAAEV